MKQYLITIFVVVFVVLIIAFTYLRPPGDGGEPAKSPADDKPTPRVTPQVKDISAPSTPVSIETPIPSSPSPTPVEGFRIEVETSDGEPVDEVRVELYRKRAILLPVAPKRAKVLQTDIEGKALLSSDYEDDYILRVYKEGYAPTYRPFPPKTKYHSGVIRIVMSHGDVISGTVSNTEGTPLNNITVGPFIPEPQPESRQIFVPEFSKTDSEKGSFTFHTLGEGPFTLHVSTEGYQPKRVDNIIPGMKDLEIVLEKGGCSVKGVTVGSRDGKPIPDIGLLLVGNNNLLYTESGDDGTFEFSNLPDGDYYIKPIRNDTRMGKPVEVTCNEAMPVVENIIVKVNQGIIISGTVTSALDSQPLADVILQVGEGENPEMVYTDREGYFAFTNFIPEGQLAIVVASEEYRFKDEDGNVSRFYPIEGYMPDKDIENIEIPVVKKYEIKGEVVNINPDTKSRYNVYIEPINSIIKNQQYRTDIHSDGTFLAKCVGSGTYGAVVRDPNNNLAGEPMEFTLLPRENPPVLQLRITDPVTVRGLVLDHLGNPLDNCKVTVEGTFEDAEVYSDENGAFSFDTHENTLHVMVASPEYTQILEQEVTLPVRDRLIFQFSAGNLLEGMVVDPEGEPVPDATIFYSWVVEESGKPRQNSLTVNNNGRFAITDIESSLLDRLVCQAPSRSLSGKKLGKSEHEDIQLPDDDFVIVLPELMEIILDVRDNMDMAFSGKGIAEISSLDADTGNFTLLSRESVTVVDGRCTLADITPAVIKVDFKTVDGHVGSSDMVDLREVPSPVTILVRLVGLQELDGYVYDERTRNPLEMVRVALRGSRSGSQLFEKVTSTTPQGYFQLKGIPDGDYDILFIKTGYNTVSEKFAVIEGTPDVSLPMEVYISPAGLTLEGTVLDNYEEPEPLANVTLRRIADSENLSQTWSTRSDDLGYFSFKALTQGEYLLNVRKEGLVYSERITLSGDENENVEVILQNMVTVTGTLTVDDTTLYEQPLIFTHKITGKPYRAELGSEGTFSLALPPGDYKVVPGEAELYTEAYIPADVETYEIDISF